MKVRFLQDYQGQHTGPHFHKAGQVVDLDDSTVGRLLEDKRVELVQEAIDYAAMTVAELRDLAGERGISTSGLRKAHLIEALQEA